MFFKDASYTEAYYASIGLSCPSLLNCTWGEFATLGLCHKTAALSDVDWRLIAGKRMIPDAHMIFPGSPSSKLPRTSFSSLKKCCPMYRQQWFNISNPFLTLVSLKRHNYTSVEYNLINLTVSSFYPCVYTTSNNVVNGVYNSHLLDSWRNQSAAVPENSLTASLPDVYMVPSQDQLHLAGQPFEAATYHIPGPVADLMRNTLRATLVVRTGFNSNGSVQAAFAYEGYGNSILVAYSFLTGGGVWEKVFASLVLGATSNMRATVENAIHRVTGYQVSVFTIINV